MAKKAAKRGARTSRPSLGWWIAGVVALVVVGAGLSTVGGRSDAPAAAVPAAAIEIDPAAPGGLAAANPVVDLGRVPFDKEVVADFELVNTGGTPVKLTAAPTVAMLEGC
jgi:hypothetical protein